MKANEFKVGDLVVKGKYDRGPLEVVEIQGDWLILGKHSRVAVLKTNACHATPEEIKAGHRIELSGNTGELEMLDMVDVVSTHGVIVFPVRQVRRIDGMKLCIQCAALFIEKVETKDHGICSLSCGYAFRGLSSY